MKAFLKLTFFWGLSSALSAQGITTPDTAIRAALQNHPLAQAAAFDAQAKKHAEKTAFNIPNPEVNAESPTGEFYTIGISQAFEFPTVYARQKQVAKTETSLVRTKQLVQANELRFNVRTLFLDAQAADFQAQQWAIRDSLFQAIAAAAKKQFAVGEIDFLQQSLVENEAGKVRVEHIDKDIKASTARQQLAAYTGLVELGALPPLQADTGGIAAAQNLTENPQLRYEQQSVKLAAQEIELAKSRALPNFSLGYMNQGVRNSPVDYRFRASIGIPLWAGQFQGGIKGAKAESQAAQARSEAESLAITLQFQRSRAEAYSALAQVQYFEKEALPRSQEIVSAALRMRDAGQIDYLALLRLLDESFAVQQDYGLQLYYFNTAKIQMQYLEGL